MPCKYLFVKIFLALNCLILSGCSGTISSIEKQQNIKFKVNDPNASYFDVQERREFIKKDIVPIFSSAETRKYEYDCSKHPIPDPVDYYLVMPAFYKNRSGWLKAWAPLREFEQHITQLANLFVTTGKQTYAQCLVDALVEWAKKESLLRFDYEGNDKQAWYAIEWTTSSAGLAYSIIRANDLLNPKEKRKIEHWLKKVAKNQISYPGGPTTCCNNHSYWRGLEAAIVGVVTDDNDFFRFGIKKYISAINSMNKDGSFPLEMARGYRAIHYQNFAILPLVYIAEIAARQGYDLYSLSIDGKDLHLAIRFLMRCIGN
jgi:poly(beta-D-mannuronate) lyase